jgi:acetylornithine deacetylase/succinyl-diaminopimelate desuccinylase-like protein
MNPATEVQPISIDAERCAEILQAAIRIRSVVGEETTAHLWLTEQLRGLGFEVNSYPVEGRKAPLILGVLEGEGSKPGVMFDAHYDTVGARASDWDHDPWGAEREGDVIYGRGAVDSKGSQAAMLAAIEAVVNSGQTRQGPIFFMSDSDGEDGFRGPALLSELDVIERTGTIFSAEATKNSTIEIAYPGLATWKITAIGRTAHPTEPEHGINAIAKMADLVRAVEAGELEFPAGDSRWFEPRVTVNAIRTMPGGGWAIPGRCDAVLSTMTPIGVSVSEVGDAIGSFLKQLEEKDGEVKFEFKILPMGAGRLWLRPGEVDPEHAGVKALEAAVGSVAGREASVREFNGGWVSATELMRTGEDGFGSPAAITFGPGDFAQAHAVDENISLTEVSEAAAIYASATLELLS